MQIRLYKMLTKINQSYFDHSNQFCMHYFRTCMQNILIFQLILEQNVQFFVHSFKIPNNYQITEKKNEQT